MLFWFKHLTFILLIIAFSAKATSLIASVLGSAKQSESILPENEQTEESETEKDAFKGKSECIFYSSIHGLTVNYHEFTNAFIPFLDQRLPICFFSIITPPPQA